MRKIILISVLLCISLKVNAQCLEDIQKQNVFFILLEDKDSLTNFGCLERPDIGYCSYHFLKLNKEPFEFSFRYAKYRHIDDFNNDMNRSMLFRVDKSFIRKNKNIIITRELMEKMGDRKMINLLYSDISNRTIFLINTADTKDGKLLIREVALDVTLEE